jgi:hypothetical protein
MALAALVAIACFSLAGCGRAGVAPSPTPADFAGIVEQLAKAGIRVTNVVSGDAGCPDTTLTPTAIGFDASGLDQPVPLRIRVYMFRNRESWQHLAGTVAACARSYVSDPSTYESLAPSPFVVSGQGPWPARFAAGLETAFTAAAGSSN